MGGDMQHDVSNKMMFIEGRRVWLLLLLLLQVIAITYILPIHGGVSTKTQTEAEGIKPLSSSRLSLSTATEDKDTSRRYLQEAERCLSFVTDYVFEFQEIETRTLLHVDGDSKVAGAAIVKKAFGSGSSYEWKLVGDGTGKYHIINMNSGLAITLDESTYPETNVIQNPIPADGSGAWCFQDGGGGSYEPFLPSNGRRIVVSSTYRWQIKPLGSLIIYSSPVEPREQNCREMNVEVWYQITARHSGKALQIQQHSTKRGKLLIQDAIDDGSKSYEWQLKGSTNGRYRLINVNSGYEIKVRKASTSPGTFLQQNTVNKRNNGNHCFETVEGWFFSITPENSGLSFTVPGGNMADGTKLIQDTYEGNLSQQFLLTPIQSGINRPSAGKWEGPYGLPLVAASAANLADGKILMWSAARVGMYGGKGKTQTAIFDPNTNRAVREEIRDTNHDMFCPGTAVLEDQRVLITGGSNSEVTTIYDPNDDTWTRGSDMNIPRGYHSMTVLGDGTVFTIGGSFSGGLGNKHGEIYDPNTDEWTLKSGLNITDSILTSDSGGIYRSDNHMWFFTAPNGLIFHAGPSFHMHWIDTSGDGQIIPAKTRGSAHAMNGNAVMYDTGKILVLGGAPNYNLGDAYDSAYTIDINGGVGGEIVAPTANMLSPRVFCNSAVLPNGEVVVVGGTTVARIFTDVNHVLFAEIWNPTTGKFLPLASMKMPRTYHSVAILMKDGRVLVAAGGLCGSFCGAENNHFETEIFTPPYLLSDDGLSKTRPSIVSLSKTTVTDGDTFSVTMDTGGSHTFALVRLSAVTHSVNNDVRRIPLPVVNMSGSNFNLKVPDESSIALPGTYFLFAMNSAGTPSVGVTVSITLP